MFKRIFWFSACLLAATIFREEVTSAINNTLNFLNELSLDEKITSLFK